MRKEIWKLRNPTQHPDFLISSNDYGPVCYKRFRNQRAILLSVEALLRDPVARECERYIEMILEMLARQLEHCSWLRSHRQVCGQRVYRFVRRFS